MYSYKLPPGESVLPLARSNELLRYLSARSPNEPDRWRELVLLVDRSVNLSPELDLLRKLSVELDRSRNRSREFDLSRSLSFELDLLLLYDGRSDRYE